MMTRIVANILNFTAGVSLTTCVVTSAILGTSFFPQSNYLKWNNANVLKVWTPASILASISWGIIFWNKGAKKLNRHPPTITAMFAPEPSPEPPETELDTLKIHLYRDAFVGAECDAFRDNYLYEIASVVNDIEGLNTKEIPPWGLHYENRIVVLEYLWDKGYLDSLKYESGKQWAYFLSQKQRCRQCTYYFGECEINCAPHPHGSEGECNDFEMKG